MRDQFYGDRKDVWEWTVTAVEARKTKAVRIVYAAMMRPNDDSEAGHGKGFAPCTGAEECVVDFFERERRAFGGDNGNAKPAISHRRVHRIVDLAPAIEMPIAFVGALYRARTAAAYFTEQVLPWLQFRNGHQPLVVLLDPDTGLAQSPTPNDKQLGTEQLLIVWNALKSDDVLILYCEPCRAEDALQTEAARVEKLLGAPVRPCAFPFNSGQGYLVARRPN
jgi:hypothetical protein